jgi:hypothetical protein
MNSANTMAGQKRERSDDDEFDWEYDLEWRKVSQYSGSNDAMT